MSNTDPMIPNALVKGGLLPGNHGFVDGDWFVEEDVGASRLAIRTQKKLHEETSPYQTIAVYQSAYFGKFLTLDGAMMFTERDEFVYHEMLTHVPLCSMPEPKQVLIIGGGDCGCLREALKHPSVERVVQVDIDERVTRVSAQYFDWLKEAMADPRAELIFDDGVKFIDGNAGVFDLIIVDSTDPVGPAVGLFLGDFYKKVASALKPGGIMTAQTETPHWGADMVGAIYKQIGAGFAHVDAYLGWIPTYPSGAWSWAYASNGRTHKDFFDAERAAAIEKSSLYYNSAVHHAAFALPNFVRSAVQGTNPFQRFDRRHIEAVKN